MIVEMVGFSGDAILPDTTLSYPASPEVRKATAQSWHLRLPGNFLADSSETAGNPPMSEREQWEGSLRNSYIRSPY